MDFTIPEHGKALQVLMRRFVKEECLPVEREMMLKDPDWVELPKETFTRLRSKLKDIGLWAIDVPEQYGGQGLDTLSYCLIAEEQYQTVLGTTHYSPFWGTLSVLLFPALYRGTQYQKDKYLYPLIKGEKRAAYAHTEPDAGSDAAAIKTAATKDGVDWVINGVKRFSTMADRADFIYVTAVTDKSKGREGFSTFMIDKDTLGMKIDRIWQVIRPQYSTEIVFDNCRVPDSQRLEGSGLDNFQEGMAKMRMLMAQGCVGRAVRALDIATQYVQERKTFGQPLSERQAIQWMLVDSAIDIHALRLLALEGAWMVDHGLSAREHASLIKIYAAEAGLRVLDRCIQCLGGIGLTKDFPLERWYRELRVMQITEGPNEIHRMILARRLFRGWHP